ncbi:MAG: class I SAM-dependent methyltransferase [Actinomycetota bacterium]|nr:class I SAM-dependent methyltransferase [Actinomycetota bacterium]
MNDRLVDRQYLTGVQYASDANLASRQAIYRFQQPPVRAAAWALDLAVLRGNERILDVGCGNGMYLAEFARREHRGAVTGMDLSPGMLSAARTRSTVSLLVGDAQRLPFGDGSYDRVLAMHMLYHVPDRDLAISEMRRVLLPDGVVLVLTNSRRHLQEMNALIGDVAHEVLGRRNPERAYWRFSSESGDEELRRHFASVTRHDARSELVVSEVQPIVDYVASGWSLAMAPDGGRESVLREVERRSRAVIEADGAFRIRTDVGCFVCR